MPYDIQYVIIIMYKQRNSREYLCELFTLAVFILLVSSSSFSCFLFILRRRKSFAFCFRIKKSKIAIQMQTARRENKKASQAHMNNFFFLLDTLHISKRNNNNTYAVHGMQTSNVTFLSTHVCFSFSARAFS